MHINRIGRALEIYKNQGNRKVEEKPKLNSKQDELKLSASVQDYQFAKAEIKKIPELRQDKVDEIKQRIEAGTYEIDAKKIAEKIIASANIDLRI